MDILHVTLDSPTVGYQIIAGQRATVQTAQQKPKKIPPWVGGYPIYAARIVSSRTGEPFTQEIGLPDVLVIYLNSDDEAPITLYREWYGLVGGERLAYGYIYQGRPTCAYYLPPFAMAGDGEGMEVPLEALELPDMVYFYRRARFPRYALPPWVEIGA